MVSRQSRTLFAPSLLTFVLLVPAPLASPLHATETGLDTGQLFPDLVLPALEDGSLRSVSSFRGKKTLLLVYASW